jgi:hypothetical protein
MEELPVTQGESMRGPQKASVPLGLEYRHVDVFSGTPLSGNGVTVFWLREALPTAAMQDLTREMRQFESIFVLREGRSQTVRAWVFTMEEELGFAEAVFLYERVTFDFLEHLRSGARFSFLHQKENVLRSFLANASLTFCAQRLSRLCSCSLPQCSRSQPAHQP